MMAARQLKLGSKSFDFVDLCTVKLNCPAIQEKFLEGIDMDGIDLTNVLKEEQAPALGSGYANAYLSNS
jgi:hypothetical protein